MRWNHSNIFTDEKPPWSLGRLRISVPSTCLLLLSIGIITFSPKPGWNFQYNIIYSSLCGTQKSNLLFYYMHLWGTLIDATYCVIRGNIYCFLVKNLISIWQLPELGNFILRLKYTFSETTTKAFLGYIITSQKTLVKESAAYTVVCNKLSNTILAGYDLYLNLSYNT